MTSTFRPKVWVGLTATLATSAIALAAASAADAGAATHHSPFQIALSGGEGGEGGGEGGEGGPGALDPLAGAQADEALEVRLLLMQGHLDVGHELYLAGLNADASPHLSHPSTELYGKVEPELKAHNLPGFHDKLDAVHKAFDAKAPQAEFEKAYIAARTAIEGAIAAIDAKATTPPSAARLAYLVLNVAAGEYSNSIGEGDDRIVAAVEYQDALGFFREAQALVRSHGQDFGKRDMLAFGKVVQHFDTLKTAWPNGAVPKQVVLTPARFHAEVLALTGLLRGFE